MQRLMGFSLAFLSVFLVFYILIAAQSFFIPLLVALVIAYFIIAVAEGVGKIPLGKRHIPTSLAFIVAICVLLGAVSIVFSMIGSNVNQLLESGPVYQEKFQSLVGRLFDFLGKPLPDLSKKFAELDLASLLTQIVLVLTDIASSAGLIAIYVLFILIEYHYCDQKMDAFFKSEHGRESARKIIGKVTRQIKSYLRIKTFLSLLTSLCSYAVLTYVGVDFADFWALLIFFFNFIPTIGSIIATIFPCLLTLLQFGALMPFLTVSISLIAIQFVVGNVLEPKVMGKQFNLSGLVIILSLTIWGQIWGVVGMLLCVPLMMIVSIVLANFPNTRPMAILLSQTGALDD